MASTKKHKSLATKARAAKTPRSAQRPDAGDKAADLMNDVQAELEDVVEGARLGMLASRERGEKLIALVQQKKLQVARNFYDIGKALSELQRDKLYVALGSHSFSRLLQDRDLLGLSQAKKLIAIADAFDRTKALQLGTEKAYALVRMAKATPEDDTPQKLAAGKLRIAGKLRQTSALTVADVHQAARSLQAKTGSARRPSPEERSSVAAAKRLQASLRKAGAKGAAVEAKRLAGDWKLVVTVAAAHAELLERLSGGSR